MPFLLLMKYRVYRSLLFSILSSINRELRGQRHYLNLSTTTPKGRNYYGIGIQFQASRLRRRRQAAESGFMSPFRNSGLKVNTASIMVAALFRL